MRLCLWVQRSATIGHWRGCQRAESPPGRASEADCGAGIQVRSLYQVAHCPAYSRWPRAGAGLSGERRPHPSPAHLTGLYHIQLLKNRTWAAVKHVPVAHAVAPVSIRFGSAAPQYVKLRTSVLATLDGSDW